MNLFPVEDCMVTFWPKIINTVEIHWCARSILTTLTPDHLPWGITLGSACRSIGGVEEGGLLGEKDKGKLCSNFLPSMVTLGKGSHRRLEWLVLGHLPTTCNQMALPLLYEDINMWRAPNKDISRMGDSGWLVEIRWGPVVQASGSPGSYLRGALADPLHSLQSNVGRGLECNGVAQWEAH